MDRRCWLAKSARLVATAIFGGPAWRKGCQLPRRENRPILFGEYFFGSCMTRRRRFQRGRPLRVAHWRPRGARFPRINARAWHIMLPQRWIGLKRGGAEASLFRRRAPRSPPTVQPSAAFTASSSPDARFAAAKLDPLTDRAPWPRQIHRRPGRPPRPVLLRARSSSHDPDFPAPPPNERVASRSFQDPECRPSARRDTSSAASRPRRGPLGEGRQPPDRSLSKTRHVKVSFQGRSPGRGAGTQHDRDLVASHSDGLALSFSARAAPRADSGRRGGASQAGFFPEHRLDAARVRTRRRARPGKAR
jgi:hypothetical protein